MQENEIENKINQIEEMMALPDFWNDKIKAQEKVKELQDLKSKKAGVEAFDKGPAIMTILSGAGGDDAEDFSSMLFRMYQKYITRRG